MKRGLKIFLMILILAYSLTALPTFCKSSDYGSIPMCERFSLTGNEGNSSINFRFYFTPDYLVNITVISDQTSTSNITIDVTAEEEQNISVLQPGGMYNFLKSYPWTPISILYEASCNITLNDLSKNCSGIILFSSPQTNCTLFDTETTTNFSSITSIGSALIILFTCVVAIIRSKRKN